jgi:uncharacterized protein (DUF952 family)
MSIIYHITTSKAWKDAQSKGLLEESSLREEGFIHCSEERQITGVLSRHFKDKKDLVRLTIDSAKLTSPLIYDWSPSMRDTFPHIYGPIQAEAVIAVDPV